MMASEYPEWRISIERQAPVWLRCEELLAGCTPLLHDLKAIQGSSNLDQQDAAYFKMLHHQFQQVIPSHNFKD